MSPPDAQLTHIGLYVRDLDAMVSFYAKLLGMVVTDTGELRGNRITFMSRNANEHHQLVMVSGRPSDEYSPVNQMSFRVNTLEDLQQYYQVVKQMELRDLRPSNHGNAWSIYFLDIEGNRIEIYTGSPWYVNQPYQRPLDLDAPSDDIRASTKALVMQDSSFTPHETWQQSLKERLSA
jgi:catechol-2,3-dioxygenase